MCIRDRLYTGLSRATTFELVLTQPQTINSAMKKFANMERRSFLQEFLDEFNNTIIKLDYEDEIEEDDEEEIV